MTAYSTQGAILEIAQQAAFGTAQTSGFKDVRVEGEPTVMTPVGDPTRPDTLYNHSREQDKPIVIHTAKDNAMVAPSLIRQPASAGGDTYLKYAFEAFGCTVSEIGADTTIDDVTPSATEFDVASATGFAAGKGCVVAANSQYLPTLINSVSSSTITTQMGLAAAPSNGAVVNDALTVTPPTGAEIAGTKLCTLRLGVNALDGDPVRIDAQDAAVTAMADLSITPNERVIIEPTWGCSDLSANSAAWQANDFIDAAGGVKLVHEPYAQFAAASTSGAISAAYHCLISATFSWGVSVAQIPGFGSTACNNNIGGWISRYVPADCKLTLEMLYDSNKLNDFDNANASKYVAIIQPGAAETDASWGLFLPNAHCQLVEAQHFGNNEHRVTVTYTPNVASLGDDTTTGIANAPWYFVMARNAS